MTVEELALSSEGTAGQREALGEGKSSGGLIQGPIPFQFPGSW